MQPREGSRRRRWRVRHEFVHAVAMKWLQTKSRDIYTHAHPTIQPSVELTAFFGSPLTNWSANPILIILISRALLWLMSHYALQGKIVWKDNCITLSLSPPSVIVCFVCLVIECFQRSTMVHLLGVPFTRTKTGFLTHDSSRNENSKT